MLNIIQNYLTKNRCYQRNVKRVPIGIQLHTIGTAQGTAQSVADYWNQEAVSACVTYIVDCDTPGKVLQCLPEDVRSWADAGYGNNNLITFEICESDYMKYTSGASYKILNEEKFKADILRGYNSAILLCADICKRYGWNPTAKLPSGLYLISSHDEGRRAGLSSAHVDPTHIWPKVGKDMDGFRADVKAAMGEGESTDGNNISVQSFVVQAGSFTSKANAEKLFRKIKKAGFDVIVKKQESVYKVQCGVFESEENAKVLMKELREKGFEAIIK